MSNSIALIISLIVSSCLGEKPYSCKQEGCKKAFSSHHSLKTHLVRHNKLKVLHSATHLNFSVACPSLIIIALFQDPEEDVAHNGVMVTDDSSISVNPAIIHAASTHMVRGHSEPGLDIPNTWSPMAGEPLDWSLGHICFAYLVFIQNS